MILQTLAGMRVRQRAAALPCNRALAAFNTLIDMPLGDPDWDAAWDRARAAVSAWEPMKLSGCRCEDCALLSRNRRQRLRDRCRGERVLGVDGRMVHPRAPHGTTGGYDNWICRCVDCTESKALVYRVRTGR